MLLSDGKLIDSGAKEACFQSWVVPAEILQVPTRKLAKLALYNSLGCVGILTFDGKPEKISRKQKPYDLSSSISQQLVNPNAATSRNKIAGRGFSFTEHRGTAFHLDASNDRL